MGLKLRQYKTGGICWHAQHRRLFVAITIPSRNAFFLLSSYYFSNCNGQISRRSQFGSSATSARRSHNRISIPIRSSPLSPRVSVVPTVEVPRESLLVHRFLEGPLLLLGSGPASLLLQHLHPRLAEQTKLLCRTCLLM